eukprot:1189690-Prorocentrum_minimum.AAC.1
MAPGGSRRRSAQAGRGTGCRRGRARGGPGVHRPLRGRIPRPSSRPSGSPRRQSPGAPAQSGWPIGRAPRGRSSRQPRAPPSPRRARGVQRLPLDTRACSEGCWWWQGHSLGRSGAPSARQSGSPQIREASPARMVPQLARQPWVALEAHLHGRTRPKWHTALQSAHGRSSSCRLRRILTSWSTVTRRGYLRLFGWVRAFRGSMISSASGGLTHTHFARVAFAPDDNRQPAKWQSHFAMDYGLNTIPG